jgi:subtilisin family serine protease
MARPCRGKTRRILATLLALLLAAPAGGAGSSAQTLREQKAHFHKSPKGKLAPDLAEALEREEREEANPNAAAQITLGQLRRQKQMRRVIVSLSGAATESTVKASLLRLGGHLQKIHPTLGLATIEVPSARVRELAAETEVDYISPDRPVTAFGHIETTTGALSARSLVSGTTVDGRGIGIAIIDSGVDGLHKLIKASAGHPGIVAQRDFVGSNAVTDRYGHGTHVASLAAGSKDLKGTYLGVAPGAKLINLKVLKDDGTGNTSHVIAAIDWCILNRNTNNYNIRVINVSVGTPVKDSYQYDPLCLAARRAYNAGIIVVAAAGNEGKDWAGRKIYGGIHSPAIDPSVLTVGAVNTNGTDHRSDDKIATYSSRGPTRGYWTDALGRKHYDNLLKPDLVAPGNKITAACSNNPDASNKFNNLVQTYPSLLLNPGSKIEDRVMSLSGTSAAAPIVAGAAALLLQTNPNLTPNLVKAILMYTAQPLAGWNSLEQGAGLLNLDGAIRIARLVKSNPTTLSNGAALLTASLPSLQASSIVKENCIWGQSVVTNYCLLYGSNLMRYWQGVYGRSWVLPDATNVSHGLLTQTPGLTSPGVLNSAGVVFADGSVLGDDLLVASGVVFADGMTYPSGVVFADGRICFDALFFSGSPIKSKVIYPGD